MAKRHARPGGAAKPDWQSDWPRNGDLKTWLRAMLRKCDAIADRETAAEKVHLPIEHLAQLGHVTEVLRYVDQFLRRLPRKEVLETVRMAEVGAEISLNAGNLPRMERYLAIAEATEQYNTRKSDVGFSLDSVRDFRADHGLLDPADAIDDEQRIKATFRRAERQFHQAIAARNRKAAQQAATEMESAAREPEEEWERRAYLGLVIDAYSELKDAAAVRRCLRKLSKEERHEILDADTLLKLGMKSEAMVRAQQDVERELKELKKATDPNIHFSANAICRSLMFLIEQGKKDVASRLLRRAQKEMPTWLVVEEGWATSAVYESFADVIALVDGPCAAKEFLQLAMADAKAEKRSDFRQGAVEGAIECKADLGMLDEAIADARKMRSATERRSMLAKLLAKAKRWTELREVLSEVASPEEAADVAWWLMFELPGGEVR